MTIITESHAALEIEHHFHTVEYPFGNNGGAVQIYNPNPFVLSVDVALPSFDTEVQIHDGTILTAYGAEMDAGTCLVRAVSDANAIYIVQMWSAPIGVGFGSATLRAVLTIEIGSTTPLTPLIPVKFGCDLFPTNQLIWLRGGMEGATGGETISLLPLYHFYPEEL